MTHDETNTDLRLYEKVNRISCATIFITLGHGAQFGLSDQGLFITSKAQQYYDTDTVIDLGPPTKENLNRLIDNMRRLECHLEE